MTCEPMTPKERRALIRHTAKQTPWSVQQIEAALNGLGDDPLIEQLAERLVAGTTTPAFIARVQLTLAVESFVAGPDPRMSGAA